MSGRPQQKKPAYIGGGESAPAGSFLTSFWRSQITAPDKREGNILIAVSTTVFAAAIIFTRTFGDLIVPQFA
ncbi:hypothetical protein BDY24DRAFT_414862 [Mrakia frigida]|uniref:uncharacterized protein n=1 Tax=Mrakia frigida TaxID=29902 RepID=UPI003FCBFD2A